MAKYQLPPETRRLVSMEWRTKPLRKVLLTKRIKRWIWMCPAGGTRIVHLPFPDSIPTFIQSWEAFQLWNVHCVFFLDTCQRELFETVLSLCRIMSTTTDGVGLLVGPWRWSSLPCTYSCRNWSSFQVHLLPRPEKPSLVEGRKTPFSIKMVPDSRMQNTKQLDWPIQGCIEK